MKKKMAGILSVTLAGFLVLACSDALIGAKSVSGTVLPISASQPGESGTESEPSAGTGIAGTADQGTETTTLIEYNEQLASGAAELPENRILAGFGAGIDYSAHTLSLFSANPDSVVSEEELPEEEEEKTPEELERERVEALQSKKWENMAISNVSSYLNIRKKASEDAKIIGKLPKNAGCTILDYNKKKDWVKIRSGKVTGWVSAEYLITGEEEVAEKAAKVGSKKAIVITETLFVREKPNTDCTILTMVPIEEELDVIKEKDGWVKVYIDNDKGWVSKDYVTISYELEKAVPIVELTVSKDGSTSGNSTSSLRANIVSYAQKFLGNRYVYGGTSLTNGTDCSGFTMQIYKHFGYSIPRTSGEQSGAGTAVSLSNIRPGDLLFYSNGYRINHVAMYIGNGQIIHASNPRSGIKISNAYYRTPVKAVRIISD